MWTSGKSTEEGYMNAKQARQLVEEAKEQKKFKAKKDLLNSIRTSANCGYTYTFADHKLNAEDADYFIELGYKIMDHTSHLIQYSDGGVDCPIVVSRISWDL